MKKGDILYIVVPCFNEQEVILETSSQLEKKISSLIKDGIISNSSRIAFVDDGSTDNTWKMITDLIASNPLFCGIKLSRNRGHQNALLAGLMSVKNLSDFTISMDADLQDDIESIDLFIEKYLDGNEIIYGVRKDRSSDSTVKRGTAELFYRTMTKMGVESVFNHADCRLLSKRALDALSMYKEVNLFLRGLIPLLGFKSDMIEYSRSPRFAGVSKYPFKKMFQLALNGITAFSITPLRFITVFGLIFSFLGICSIIVLTVLSLCQNIITGTYWILSSLWTICGFLMFCIGIVGEYVGKSYDEVKARPRYIVEDFILR